MEPSTSPCKVTAAPADLPGKPPVYLALLSATFYGPHNALREVPSWPLWSHPADKKTKAQRGLRNLPKDTHLVRG